MKALYTKTGIISRLRKAFFEIFSDESRNTKEHLFEILIFMPCLNRFQSIKYNYEQFIEYISDKKLKSYYFTLNESKIDVDKPVSKYGTNSVDGYSGKIV